MNFFRIFFLTLLACYFGGEILFSQSYNFKNYSVEEGLPFLYVDAICQDSKGNLWIGGYSGLSKYNGKTFANYFPKNGLADYGITSIVEDNDGNIWAGTINGLNKFDGRKFSTFTKKDGLAGNNITSITKDKYGRFWIGTTNGITFYNGKSFESLTTKNGLSSNNVTKVYAGKSGYIWIITDKGLSKIIFENKAPQDKSFDNYRFVNCPFTEKGEKITSITEDDNGNTWFGTSNGVVRYDGVKFITYTTKDGLSDNDIQAIAKDERSNHILVGTSNGLNIIFDDGRIESFKIKGVQNGNKIRNLFVDTEGNTWLGTRNGLYRFHDPSFSTFSEQEGLSDPFITAVFRDRKKNLWVGTREGGFHLYNSQALFRKDCNPEKSFSEKEGLIGTELYSGIEDKEGNIWMGTNKGISIYDGKEFKYLNVKRDGLKNDSVFFMMQDSKGRIWLGSNNGGTIRSGNKSSTFELKSDEQHFSVWYEFEDSKGNIWFGTHLGGLFRYDGKNYVDVSKKLNLRSKTYFSIKEDKEGILYFGSFDGVYMYDPKTEKVSLLNEKDGLSSDLVYVMSFDAGGENLYIGTNQGLNKLDMKEFKKSGKINIRQYKQEEGFNGLETNSGAIWRDDDGTFWLGTVNGLTRFNPALFHENHIEPNTSINKISIFYKDTILPPGSKLQPDQNNISFEYKGICLTNPEKVRYKFKLEGYDKDWSPETKETFARYSNLGSRKYSFKVMSCNNEGLWNKEPVSFSFEILLPVWKTWWFIVIIFVSLIILIATFSKLRADAIRRNEAERLNRDIQAANNELKALRAQMDPHFIFNSLSSIQSFIMTRDEESALRYLNKFSKLMRMILSNSEKALVTIGEEIEALKLYLELEALRWDKKFDYAIIIDPGIEIDFQKIPSMLIQPYVENAVLHGVVPKKEGKGKIEITITPKDMHVVCTISDNGIGRKKSQEQRQRSNQPDHESMGMKITSDRLEVLNRIHHSDLSVRITDMEDETKNSLGTRVEIFIPVS